LLETRNKPYTTTLALIKMNMLQKTSYIIFIILWGCQENSKKENNSYSEPIITKEKSVIESSFIVENYKTKFDWSKVV
jgi:hypothetical protein